MLVVEDLGSVASARAFVAECLTAHGLAELAADAELVVSELATNALLHAHPPVDVVVRVSGPQARIEVHDRAPHAPVHLHAGPASMTGRGLRLVDGLARSWGVEPLDSGKRVWADLELGAPAAADVDPEALLALWADEEPLREPTPGAPMYTVRLGDVPTDLLLDAKSHVDDLVREFALAVTGASSGVSGTVPAHLAELIEEVVHRFTEPRRAIRRQALAAQRDGRDHVTLELRLAPSAADAARAYLRALDEADAYSRAARLLTLESPPQHRVFRHWYIEELVAQLERAAAGEDPGPAETFEQRLLREIDRMAGNERRVVRAARLYELAASLAAARTPADVSRAALDAGAAVLGASGGAVLVAEVGARLGVPGTVGYDARIVGMLEDQPLEAELPAATAVRTGEPVWLESPAERDACFPGLAGLEPESVAMVAVPLVTGDRVLGALRFSFAQARLFDEDERSFVLAIAAQTAQALDRAQLAQARGDAARRLQRSLLPPALPEVPGVTISVAYQPLTGWLDMGGDFYDVWRRGPDRLALAVGDVSGHGPEAAAVSALVRHTLRALTLASSDPVAILGQLDGALRDALGDTDRFATVVFGFLTVAGDSCRLDLASGGHPPPVVVRGDGRAEVLDLDGSLLGIVPEPRIQRRQATLGPGDELVVVTDGVTDARDGRGEWFACDRVLEAVRSARATGAGTAETVAASVLRHTGGSLHDDLAVLALRCTAPAVSAAGPVPAA